MDQKTQAKYTPGPWHCGLLPLRVIARPMIGDGATVVASCGGRTKEEAEANARLISLAPRMVDALRDALPILEEAEAFAWEQEGGAEVLPQANEVRAILREIDEEES
ncbi:MAG: hypothetical protein WC565_10670 [Parcubacteria group bacterium]